ncbi:hypothetical protein [Pedobacter metabolipauper]|nr:hypothetical protein [Pedobacter metabolipauper]
MRQLSEWWEQSKFLNNLIPGLYTSLIFLLMLYFLKPRLKIGNKIALELFPNDPAGQTHLYSFKVINKSLFFKVYDLHICAWVSKIEPSVNADDVSYQPIKIRKQFQWVIHRLYAGHFFQKFLAKDQRLERRTDYAAQFSTFEDIRGMIANGHFITVEILAKHSLTGFTRVITKKYKHVSDIITGTYYSGNSCEIKP